MIEVVGRDPDIARICEWIASGEAVTLVIDGAAGVGKTTVLAAALGAVQVGTRRILTTSPSEAESRLSYSGLSDLLSPHIATIRSYLPRPQARALAVAMRLEDAGDQPADETAVARGFLEALRVLARDRPVLVAIDDIMWLDAPSLSAVLYAARRLEPRDRVRILTTHRAGAPEPEGMDQPDSVMRLALGPLSIGGIHRVLRLHAGLSLSRPRMLQIHAAALGNPLHALELARALEPGVPLSRGSLATLLRARIAALPPPTRRALVLIAASADRSMDRLARAGGAGFDDSIAPAVSVALVAIERGQARPTHPLVTHIAYDAASPAERRAAHRKLAATATDGEERALHLGRSADGPDAGAADDIEAAAGDTRSRGVRAQAANLFETAARLTPPEAVEDRARRLLAAAAAWFDSGDTDRVETILGPLIADLPPGRQRCEARWRLGIAIDEAGRWREATTLWDEALAESDDLALRSQIQCSMAITALYTASSERAVALAAAGVAEAERSSDTGALARSLGVLAFLLALRGDASHGPTMERALALEATIDEPLGEWSPSVLAAECARHSGDVDAALRHFRAVLDRVTDAGDANIQQWAAFGLAWTQIVAGDFGAASDLADLVLDIADQTRVMRIPARTLRAHVDAWLGDLARARALASEAVDLATAADEAAHRFAALTVLATILRFEGDLASSAETFRESRGLAARIGFAHASALRMFLAEAETAAAAGRLEQAREAVATFVATVGGAPPAWSAPIVRRARAAILAAEGDFRTAIPELEAALAEPGILPPDRAQTLLALGSAHRRLREHGRAREALVEARAAFEALRTPPWIGVSERELQRIPGRRTSPATELSAAEARIAELVAAGHPNKSVAVELGLSVKTVEVTLTRVYAKLGVRSRMELAHRLGTVAKP